MALMVARRRKEVPKWKKEEVRRLKELLLKHEIVAIADITGLGSYQLYEIRRKLSDKAVFRVSKNTLMKRAIMEIKSSKPGIEKLVDHLKGQNIFIFTSMNPFELYLFLERNKVPRPARPGDIAPEDIVIPAGNTGLPPGPIISKFNQYNVPIRIEEGSIVIVKDTVVAKKGETIPPDLAELLNRLDLKPIKIGLRLKAAYCMGRVLSEDELKIDIDEYRENLIKAYNDALRLAIGIAYPVKELLGPIIANAYLKALGLAISIQAPIPDVIPHVLMQAIAEAQALATVLGPKCPELGMEVKVSKPEEVKVAKEEKEEEKPEKEEEEEVLEGLASLFG